MDKTTKLQIDNMSYREMLYRWRFAPMGDPLLQPEIGEYFRKKMQEKKDKLEPGEAVSFSKEIGWALI